MKNRPVPMLIFFSMLLVIFASIIITNTPISVAQEITPSPEATFDPFYVPLEDLELPADPANYHIVYILAEDSIPADRLASPENYLGEILKPTIAHTWDEVLQLEAESPIEALVVHESVYDEVDREWIAAAVRQGMVLAVTNMYFAEAAELIDSDCDRAQVDTVTNPFEAYYADYYFMTSSLVLADNPDEQEALVEAVFDTCGRNGITGAVYGFSRNSIGKLNNEYAVMGFAGKLLGHLQGIHQARENFDNRVTSEAHP